jgi:small subunit ribosomal protein S19
MGRSLKKGPFVAERLLEKIRKKTPGDKSPIKTWYRNSTITPEMIGVTFEVHNGKTFIKVFVSDDMVGHKLGEFSPTRKFQRHGGRLQKEVEMKAGENGKPVAPKPDAKKE